MVTLATRGSGPSIVTNPRTPFITVSGSGTGSSPLLTRGSVAETVRGFTAPELLLQRLVKQRPKDGEESAAEAIWGKPSNFQVADINNGSEVTEDTVVIWPDDQGNFSTSPVVTINFTEVDKETEDVRIENPDDSEQYVIVRRRKTTTLKGPDLRPKDMMTPGGATYPSTLDGSLAKIAALFDAALGGQLTSVGTPQITRPAYALYKITFKNDDLGGTVV